LAAKLVQRHPGARVLVLEAGPFWSLSTCRNLGDLGLNVAAPLEPAADPGVARELVWGLTWRSNTDFPGLAYCCGGKSLYWGGWARRMTRRRHQPAQP
jgi:choline dehydrogenase-like flavoprotein